ncbi:MAG: hypothetical protein KKD29_05385 [Candidatus Omnitrophica bacterium]|nr:hypothetical protein [Candidatus Omnitrophota bacterium]
MARIRYLKPDFFKDEDIKELSFEARLFYQGLWIQADREGRGEDRPERLKIEIMPYDEVDAEEIMRLLAHHKKNGKRPFIVRYEIDGEKYYQIINWQKHQRPHKTERESDIPPPPKELLTVKQPLTNRYPTNISVGNGDGDGKENGKEIVNKQASPASAVSLKTKEALDSVYSQGFNIYQLINKFKKDAKWNKNENIPDEVLIKICEQYKKDKGRINQPYPWFIKVLKMESASYFANKNITESAKFKNQGIGKLADILKQMTGHNK